MPLRAWLALLVLALATLAPLAPPAEARRCASRCRDRARLCKEQCKPLPFGPRRECYRGCKLRELRCRAHCP